MAKSLSLTDIVKSCICLEYLTSQDMSFNAIRENKILAKISEFAIDVKVNNPQQCLLSLLFQSNICFGSLKETSQGDVSFTFPKRMFFIIQ